MTQWKLRSCPRCRGDLNNDTNDGSFICLQCGYEEPEGVMLDNVYKQSEGRTIFVREYARRPKTEETDLLRERLKEYED